MGKKGSKKSRHYNLANIFGAFLILILIIAGLFFIFKEERVMFGPEGPVILFVSPTLGDGEITSDTFYNVNISIDEEGLNKLDYNWNGTNFTFYDDSLLLMFNFDNRSSLGENKTFIRNSGSAAANLTPDRGASNNDDFVAGRYGTALKSVSDVYSGWSVGDVDFVENITIAVWINIGGNTSNYHSIITKSYGCGLNSGEWSLVIRNLTNSIYFYCGNTSSSSNSLLISRNTWHFIAVTFNEDTNQGVFYLDGNTEAFSNTGSCLVDGADIVTVGDYNLCNAFDFEGLLDELFAWQRVLSKAELDKVFSSNLYRVTDKDWVLSLNQSSSPIAGLSNGTYDYYAWAENIFGNSSITDIRTLVVNTSYSTAGGFCGDSICSGLENCSTCSGDCGACLDSTAPILSGINANVITNSSALIVWTSDENANSSVEYGVTTGLGSNIGDSSYVMSHNLLLDNLLDNRTYYYKANSCDASGNCANGGILSFATLAGNESYADDQEPVILLVSPLSNAALESNSITLTYSVSDYSDVINCSLRAGNYSGIDTEIENNAENNFALTLTNGEYYWNISCADEFGNIGWSENRRFDVNYAAPPSGGEGSGGGGGGGGVPPINQNLPAVGINNASTITSGTYAKKIVLSENEVSIADTGVIDNVIIDLYGVSYEGAVENSGEGVLLKIQGAEFLIKLGEVIPVVLGSMKIYAGAERVDYSGAGLVFGLDSESVRERVVVQDKAAAVSSSEMSFNAYFVAGIVILLFVAGVVCWYLVRILWKMRIEKRAFEKLAGIDKKTPLESVVIKTGKAQFILL